MTSYYLSLIIVNEMTTMMLSIAIENVFMTSFEVRDLVEKSTKDIDYIKLYKALRPCIGSANVRPMKESCEIDNEKYRNKASTHDIQRDDE